MSVELVDYGIASTIGDTIYINRKLQDCPELYQKILQHEQKHLDGHSHKLDFNEPFDLGLLAWVIKHPSSWIHFSPIWIVGGKIIWSRIMLIIHLTALAVIFACIGMVKWIS